MTIAQVQKKYFHPETDILLGDVLKQSKEFLYLYPDKRVTKAQIEKFRHNLNLRKKDYPLAYIRSYKDFAGLRFKVTKDTLIPRPESEWLVEQAEQILGSKKSPIILDIGTGSGNLAISIKKLLPKATVHATDISQKALAVAKSNARSHRVKINFRKQDLLTNDKRKYDLIIANLPYVPKSFYKKNYSNLKHEPKFALIDNRQDFEIYKKLLTSFQGNLKPTGVLLLEIDPTMKPLITKLLKHSKTREKVIFSRDINKLWRFASITPYTL